MKTILKTLVTFGLAVFFVFQVISLKSEYESARVTALDALSPDVFNIFVTAVESQQPLEHKTLKAYLRYFKDVARLSPQRADAVGMQGFCYYHLGQYDRAVESYTKAIGLVPQFFGFHYNLAVVDFKTGQYAKAADELNKALSFDPKASLAYIFSSSKIYGMILIAKMQILGKPVEQQFEENYRKAYQLMVATQYHLQKNETFPGEDKLSLEIF